MVIKLVVINNIPQKPLKNVLYARYLCSCSRQAKRARDDRVSCIQKNVQCPPVITNKNYVQGRFKSKQISIKILALVILHTIPYSVSMNIFGYVHDTLSSRARLA